MLRLPPTKIELSARDLEWHSQRWQNRPPAQPTATAGIRRQPFLHFRFPGSAISKSASLKSKEEEGLQEAEESSYLQGRDSLDSFGASSSTQEETSERGGVLLGEDVQHSRDDGSVEDLRSSLQRFSMDSQETGVTFPTNLRRARTVVHPSPHLLPAVEPFAERPSDIDQPSTPLGRGYLTLNTIIGSPQFPYSLPEPTSQGSSEYATPPGEPRLPTPFSATPRDTSWNYSLPSASPLRFPSSSSGRHAPQHRPHGTTPSPRSSLEQPDQRSGFATHRETQNMTSNPPAPPIPHTPPRSSIRVYHDDLPAYAQPQTPAGLPRRGVPAMQWDATFTAPRTLTLGARRSYVSILATPVRPRTARQAQMNPRDDATPGDGTADQENAARFFEWERREQIIREQELEYATGNSGELGRTPPPELRRRPWRS